MTISNDPKDGPGRPVALGYPARPVALHAGDAALPPASAAGVTEASIEALVHAFYGRIREDAQLAPIFGRILGDGWDAHLARMCDFWSSVLLRTGRFSGSPMRAHAAIPELGPEMGPAHFKRWLTLFELTATETCPPAAAAVFVAKSRMIAASLQLGIAASRGELPALAAHASSSRTVPPAGDRVRKGGREVSDA